MTLASNPVDLRNKVVYLEDTRFIRGRAAIMSTSQENPVMQQQSPAPAPTFAEMAAALAALNHPQPHPDKDNLGKHIAAIVVASAIAIGIYVVSGVNGMQQTMSGVKVTVDQSAKTLDQMQRDVKSLSDQQGDLKTQMAELKQRVENLEKVR